MTHTETDEAALARALKPLAEIEAAVETPPRVEAAVMARWDAAHRPRARSRRPVGFVRGAATTAAGVTLIAALAWQRGVNLVPTRAAVPNSRLTPPTAEPPVATDPAALRGELATVAFVGEPVQANEPVRIVRMRVARSALTELGISSPAQAETIDIDVLVGEDGVARGVRMSM